MRQAIGESQLGDLFCIKLLGNVNMQGLDLTGYWGITLPRFLFTANYWGIAICGVLLCIKLRGTSYLQGFDLRCWVITVPRLLSCITLLGNFDLWGFALRKAFEKLQGAFVLSFLLCLVLYFCISFFPSFFRSVLLSSFCLA